MPAQTVIKIRRDTSTNWESVNPTLAAGEIAFETDTNKIKVGDGSTVWASLDYASGAGTAAEITYDSTDAELIATTVKGALDELSLTKADVSQLSTNLAVFATTAASDISGYNVLVSSIDNPDYNDTAVDVATGAINADAQLIASLASSAGLFEGQVDPITVTTIGNIRKTAGNANQSASFYFEVYVRNAAGTETLVGTSDDTGEVNPPTSDYQEFSASAFVSFGTVLDTDRIVLKFYGNVSEGAGAEYDFQFGGNNPIRTLIPVPATVAVAHIASSVEVDTTNFDGLLSGSDTTVQAALETIDDLDISAGVITSDSPPSAPSNGDLWWESDTGILYIYYDNFWVEAVAGIVGPQGETGATGATGDDGIVQSATEPTNQDVLWIDTDDTANSVILPAGGTTGQVLSKTSGTDYDTEWSTVDLSTKQDNVITTQGDLVIGDASGDPVRLPVGSADQVLTSDGTTVSFQDAAGGGGQTVIATGTLSGTTTISSIPDDYKDLKILVTGVSDGGSDFNLRFKSSGSTLGSNYEIKKYDSGFTETVASANTELNINDLFKTSGGDGVVVVTVFGYSLFGNKIYNYSSAPQYSALKFQSGVGIIESSGDIDELQIFCDNGFYQIIGVA